MTPRPPALETAAARRPPEVRAMPARRTGCRMPRRVVRGVVMGPCGCDMVATKVQDGGAVWEMWVRWVGDVV